MTSDPAGLPLSPDPQLKDLAALALDCQTTGANAARDHLLEIGWVRIGPRPGADQDGPVAFLAALPEMAVLPPRVAKLTGIQDSDLKTGLSPDRIWQTLVDTVGVLPAPPSERRRIVLIHYARFERPFLQKMHLRFGNGGCFPFRIICTHAIARRLLPHLPRCGLRALAGYFGLHLGEHKRAAAHAAATRGIWEHLVPLLVAQGIRRWSALAAWLDKPAPNVRVRRQYPMPRSLRLEAPDHPGVYRFRRSNGDLLYIGKSRSLKRRLNSYFQSRRRHPEHILEMLTQARDLDYILTPTALEAALLEADLIKQSVPPYNRMLKPCDTSPVFCSSDFQKVGRPGAAGLVLGPLPSAQAQTPIRFVVAQCGLPHPNRPDTADAWAASLAIASHFLPPPILLAEGVDRYRHAYGEPGDLAQTGRRLLKRGMMLWRRHRKLEAALAESGDAPLSAVADEGEWTPAAVTELLDGIVRHGSHLVRRGRWLIILANAVLSWDAVRPAPPRPRTLRIRQGRISPIPGRMAMVDATAANSPAPSRQACRSIFSSAATYDRLRVLTTEIRRLVNEERRVRLFLADGAPLGRGRLARLLNLI